MQTGNSVQPRQPLLRQRLKRLFATIFEGGTESHLDAFGTNRIAVKPSHQLLRLTVPNFDIRPYLVLLTVMMRGRDQNGVLTFLKFVLHVLSPNWRPDLSIREAGTTMHDMAQKLCTTPADLSAMEFGRRPVTFGSVAYVSHYFSDLGIQGTKAALKAAIRASKEGV